MPNPLHTYILNMYDWFGWVLWHINLSRLFNAKSSFCIYIKYIWFGWVEFYGISTIVGYLMPNPLHTYILNMYDWFGWVLWHINLNRLFNAKSSSCIYIKYIWFGWVEFYGISTIVGYLMPNPLHTYILNMYDWFGWVLWHINLSRLFNAKSSSYIYIKYIWFGWVEYYGISTIVGYLMPNPLHTYILNMYDWFGWVLWHINLSRLFNAKSSSYIYIKYIWFGWVEFYGISIIVGYLRPNPLHTYILNIYDWFGWVLWHINLSRLFNAKSSSYI